MAHSQQLFVKLLYSILYLTLYAILLLALDKIPACHRHMSLILGIVEILDPKNYTDSLFIAFIYIIATLIFIKMIVGTF